MYMYMYMSIVYEESCKCLCTYCITKMTQKYSSKKFFLELCINFRFCIAFFSVHFSISMSGVIIILFDNFFLNIFFLGMYVCG